MGTAGDQRAVVRVLGSIAVVADDRPVPVRGDKPRRLLAALTLHRNRVVSAARLMDAMWGDEVPGTGITTLQAHLSRLRRVLPAGVSVGREAAGYRLVLPPGATDIDRFESAFAAGTAALPSDPHRALDRLDAALAEWSGDAFAELAGEPWAQAEAARLTELRLHALELRLDAQLALGWDERVAGEAEALTVDHPWREQGWRLLVLALHRAGRQGDALRAAADYRGRLREQLGLDPSAEFVALERRVATEEPVMTARPAGAVPVTVGTGGPGASGAIGSVDLAEPMELVGRDTDIADAAALCRGARLVTLLGPGGVGKTQLARRVAALAADDGPLHVVELAPVRDESSVVAAVATQLDVQTQQGRSVLESVLEVLTMRPQVLLLDNCEHVLDTIAAFVERLLVAAPGVRVLTTSREPLGLPREAVYRVPALPVPPAGADATVCRASPAVDLFLQRAAAAHRDLTIDDATVVAIGQLCRRLDGMPLAIELAAARLRALSPAEIIERLDDRFALLAGHSRVADERHRSLRSLVDWSYHLLDPDAQRLFGRLSAFAGSFDLAAAERVCGYGEVPPSMVAGLLASLVDKSMVQATTGQRTTYRVLETLREYGSAVVADEAEPLTARHAAWLVEVCERGAAELHGPDELEWLDVFDRLFDDLRLAVRDAIARGDGGAALRIVVAAREHAFRRLRYELIGWAESAMSVIDPEAEPLASAALGIIAYGRFVRGEVETAIDLGHESLALAARHGTDTFGMGERALANACFFQGDMAGTREAMLRLEGNARAAGDAARLAHALYMSSLGLTRDPDDAEGLRRAEAAIEAGRRSGNPTAQAQAAYALGVWLIAREPERAREVLEHSEALARSVGNHWLELFARTETLWLRAVGGDPFGALADFAAVLEAWHRAGDWANQWLSLRHVFGICTLVGEDELAMIILGALEHAGAADAFPFEPVAAADLARIVGALRSRLGPAAVALAQQGRAGTTSAVVGLIVDRIRAITATRDRREPAPA